MRRCVLLLLLLAAPLAAQTGPLKDKDKDKDKEPPKKEPAKKEPGTKEPTAKEPAPPKSPLTIDQLKLSPEAILIIVDEMKDVLSLLPKMVMIKPETLMSMEERIRTLEKLLKQDRKPAGVCKLNGRLDGDSVVLRGEFLFSTEQPGARVFLGMQGAFLTDEGELDRALAQLEIVDDGYVVKVEKPGNHQLFLNLVIPVGLKRAPLAGGSAERSVDLGLPGSAVTTLHLELPGGVKELRWNDIQEKRKGSRWDLALGKAKSLALTWKEPVALPGTGPFLTVDTQITGKIEETQVIWSAEVALEDLRGQTKEWRLVFPAGARVDVKSATSASTWDLQVVEGQPYTHVLKLNDAGTERWLLHVQVVQARPPAGTRLVVGPFQALGAQRQQGTITIQATPEALRGQRLVFHRFGETYQRDLPRTGLNLAAFQYWSLPSSKGSKELLRAPLELEWKVERGRAETSVEHELRLQATPDAAILELTSRFRLKVLQRGVEFLDIQLPTAAPYTGLTVFEPVLPFPGGINWLALLDERNANGVKPLDFALVEGEGSLLEWLPPDNQGRARVRFLRDADKLPEVVIRGRYQASKAPGRIRVELPRPLGSAERRVEVTVTSPESVELLRGKAGLETAVAQRHTFEQIWEGPVSALEFAWRRYEPDLPVSATADVTVLERSANIVMRMQAPAKLRVGADGGVPLIVPPGISVKMREAKKADEIVLEYDVPLQTGPEASKDGQRLHLEFPWPRGATRREVTVRLWTSGGMALTLDASEPSSREWKDKVGELAPERDSLPSLVLFHSGPEPKMNLFVRAVPTTPMLVDRTLIQVKIEADGSQEYRVRHLVRKFFVRRLKLELPQAAATSLEHVLIKDVRVNWESDQKAWNLAYLNIDPNAYAEPVVLEVRYRVTPNPDETRGWRSLLTPPRWLGDVHVPLVRWQIELDRTAVVLPWAGSAHAVFSWGLIGWLPGPVPSAAATDDDWLTEQHSEPRPGVALVVDQSGLAPLTLVHVSRQVWLLLCSALVLVIGLMFVLLSLSRGMVWTLAGALTLAVLAVAWFWPTLLAYFAHGCLPGLVALALLVLGQWLVQQNYQRQVVFLPGFTRLKSGSSLTKSATPSREPSTVDAPAPGGVGKTPSSVQGS